ncbi:hypothetical protein XELAEV_18004855mg [Xenopus laevis]|uniref:Uncharacterized protein n=1 Tax=Xenopus laevis TaxID=8355 RepID=A0A974DWZ2_XENLA|nr:hypothetical protein XELAEV_18004855mg [Xenopus laevis]
MKKLRVQLHRRFLSVCARSDALLHSAVVNLDSMENKKCPNPVKLGSTNAENWIAKGELIGYVGDIPEFLNGDFLEGAWCPQGWSLVKSIEFGGGESNCELICNG